MKFIPRLLFYGPLVFGECSTFEIMPIPIQEGSPGGLEKGKLGNMIVALDYTGVLPFAFCKLHNKQTLTKQKCIELCTLPV